MELGECRNGWVRPLAESYDSRVANSRSRLDAGLLGADRDIQLRAGIEDDYAKFWMTCWRPGQPRGAAFIRVLKASRVPRGLGVCARRALQQVSVA